MKNQKNLIATSLALIVTICSYAQPTEVNGTGIMDLKTSSIEIGDINNDGYYDIIIAGMDASDDYQFKVYINNGDGTFTDLGVNIIALTDGDIALADFNADNYLDIAICGRDQSNNIYTRIYRNNQNNTFTDISAGLQGLYLGSLAWGDYDNDGDLDLLVCGQDASNIRKTLIYENRGSSNFTEVIPSIPAVSRGQAIWGDINDDGFLDIALSGLNTSNVYVTEIYVNNGNKTFNSHNANLQKLAYSNQHFVDYDNDGDLDFWISGRNNSGTDMIRLYKNTSGNFVAIAETFSPLWEVSAAWGDYDNDGDQDVIYLGQDGSTPTVYYYQNNGSDAFTLVNLGITGVYSGDISWFDYNNDHKLDIILSGRTGSGPRSTLYINNTVAANTAPAAPTGLNADVSGYQVSLTWNAGSDTQTGANGLSYRICLGTSSNNYDILSPVGNLGTGKSYLAQNGLIKGTKAILDNLPEGDYFWRIQAIDASYEGSSFTSESSFAICDPVSIGDDKEICLQGNLELSTGSGSDVVNWYSVNSGQIASNTQNLSYTITQNEEIRVEVIKAIGCTSRDTMEVTALALPSFSLPATDQACYGTINQYTAGTDDETVKWFAQNGDLLYTGNQLDYTVLNSETIKCEITGTNTCIDSAKITITSLALPQASLGEDLAICNGQSTLLQVNGMQEVNWYALPWTQIATNQEQVEISLSSDTTIVAEFYNTNNCVNYDTIMLSSSQISLVNAGNDTTICFNTSLQLGGNPTAGGGTAPYTYTWTDENGTDFSTNANPSVNPQGNTFYNLHVVDQTGCEGDDMITVAVNPQSVINPGDAIELCYGSSVELGGNPTAENSLFPYVYRWFPETGLSEPGAANPLANPLESTTYRLIVSTYYCENDTAFVTVNINSLPEITISENINIGYGGTTTIEASGGVAYEWTPTEGLSNPLLGQTEASPSETTTYIVTVTNENECQSQAAVTITVLNDLFIPSLFTPNGDSNNDFFKIYGVGIEEFNIVIYNRNGNIVFQSNDADFMLQTGWDGNSNGTKQPQGTYMYVISGRFVNGSLIDYKNNRGTINLMR